MSDSIPTEGQQRLRAVLRAVLSPGIWFVVAMHVLLVLLARLDWLPGEAGQASMTTYIALAVWSLVLLYLQGGALNALASTRERIGLGEVLVAGRAVYPQFLGLIAKVVLLLFAAVLVVGSFGGIMVAVTGNTQTPNQAAASIGPMFRTMAALAAVFLPFVFAYWLPWVFVRGHFRLAESVVAALRLAWQRLPQAGFLALMMILPAALEWLVPAATPVVLLVLVDVSGAMMAWIAATYCVERIQEMRAEPPLLDTPPTA